MEVAKSISEVRDIVKAARGRGGKVGFVPTMGALHAGHVSLIRRSVEDGCFTVVSIFVNPTQFGAGEDFEKYPRPLDADLKICEDKKVDLVFVPAAGELYGKETLTWVNVEKLTAGLCGRFRPGHFRGVATVCAKLFNIVQPDVAYFGQKDAQQAVVIKKMVAELNMPLEISICPTVRETDGLAVSSRNQYLEPAQRKDAACLYSALQKCRQSAKSGMRDTQQLIAEMRKIIEAVPTVKQIDYIEIVDTHSLQPLEKIIDKALVALAVKIGTTRLIDNVIVSAGSG